LRFKFINKLSFNSSSFLENEQFFTTDWTKTLENVPMCPSGNEIQRPSRVSFDLALEDGLSVDLHDHTESDPEETATAAIEAIEAASDNGAIDQVFLEPPTGGSTSDMSGSGSCHSSR
jgi:hypothetical protein